jgi:hypothetical protein
MSESLLAQKEFKTFGNPLDQTFGGRIHHASPERLKTPTPSPPFLDGTKKFAKVHCRAWPTKSDAQDHQCSCTSAHGVENRTAFNSRRLHQCLRRYFDRAIVFPEFARQRRVVSTQP